MLLWNSSLHTGARLAATSRLSSMKSSSLLLLRLKSSIDKSSKPTSPLKPSQPQILSTASQPIPEHIRKTIPGQTEQSNSLMSRMPSFPLKNNSALLPKPGVPTAADTPLRSMMEILSQKVEPELIYESESHKLYFLTCGALAFIFAIYGLTFIDWGFPAVWQLYLDDQDLLMLAGRAGMCSIITGVALGVTYIALKFPTRLVRRIWYLPGPVPHIKFSSHPLLPGGATPVYTVPLENLLRSHKAKVFTKNGIYGTLDKSTFFFLLKETDKKFGYWIVDRNGWFWGDGRVFDVLFGKESLEDAMKGQSYNEKLQEAADVLKSEREKMRKLHGPFWQAKLTKEMMKNDLQKVVGIASTGGLKKTDQKSNISRK